MSQTAIEATGSAMETASQQRNRRVMDTDAYRRKISDAKVVARCIKVAMGKRDATMSEVNMLGKLLNKILPDLKAVEVNVSQDKPLTMEDMAGRARALGLNPEDIFSQAASIPAESTVKQVEKEGE